MLLVSPITERGVSQNNKRECPVGTTAWKCAATRDVWYDDDDHDDDTDEGDDQILLDMLNDSDWDVGIDLLNRKGLLMEPNSELSVHDVAQICIRSLQLIDDPVENAGLQRCFPFFTWECRKLVTAQKGGDDMNSFCKYGVLSPALQPFMGARRIDLSDVTLLPECPPTRGAMATFQIQVQTSNIFSVTHLSGMDRKGITNPPIVNMVMRLEKQRRPPFQNCWLIKEIIDSRMAFAGDLGNAAIAN